ncbi:signal peptide peptidase SppA [Qipengyuania nanhaisediminis]|uniref:Signal peptide peptidase A. Serine peptidase. MEROPS family S49 n=1 Tax=Qipengyuania nanhaisediminis TaxID=604088 RepID=A0A1I5LKW5_9SPHN|nr:signal peptide peptidase SppA [Qipengyuania nanhaisediminis]SFO98029.1 signal peptide peptidase A. Serine peptidase. MEROPS family S49 [Qipengyuania nanhaisediminis]
MRFAGKVWRLLVGVKDGLVLLFMLLFFGMLFVILTTRPSPAQVREGALLLEIDGVVVEERSRIDPLQALLSSQAPVGEYQARDIVRALDAAAGDERIDAVVLDLERFLGAGQVHLQDIGEAMDRVRAANKPVLTYATAYADDGVFLAAHASEVWMNPLGGAVVAGPGGHRLYYKGLIDRLNVNARVYRVGTYKSAVEPYTQTGMSEPARENARALYGALWEEWQANVKKARPAVDLDLITQSPAEWVEAAQGDLAQASLDAGLVDKLGNRDAFNARVVELVGTDKWSKLPNAFPATEYDAWLKDNPLPSDGKPIGIVTIAGEIVDGEAGPGTAGGTRIADLLDAALDRDFAGLVVRVDSPGGSVLASEAIRDAILRHKARGVPVAVSMANVAASGGYWVSTPADRIFAEPDTITGSIGIFAVLPTFEQAAASIGVTSDGVRTGPLSGQPDLVGGLTPEVDRILQASIEDGYRDFLTRVSQARNMTLDQADEVGQGRVWDGGTARQLQLVDEYGGLEEALAWVAGQAELAGGEWHAAYLGTPPSTTDTLLRQWLVGEEDAQGRDVFALFARKETEALNRVISDAGRLLGTRGAQAYCLACPATDRGQRAEGDAKGFFERLAALFAK